MCQNFENVLKAAAYIRVIPSFHVVFFNDILSLNISLNWMYQREPFMAAGYWIFSSHSKSLLRFSWKVPSALLGRTRVLVSLYHIISILFTVQMYYTELVRNLLAQQTDRVLGQRLLDAFNQLTPSNMKLSLDRLNKMQFRKSLDLFLRSVKGFLCVK